MHPVRRQISPHAARLRCEQTDVEQVIWLEVRNRRLRGFKFRRQHTNGRYVVDFACIEAVLIVELDGSQHTPKPMLLEPNSLPRLPHTVSLEQRRDR